VKDEVILRRLRQAVPQKADRGAEASQLTLMHRVLHDEGIERLHHDILAASRSIGVKAAATIGVATTM
jgi:hypothetical protein